MFVSASHAIRTLVVTSAGPREGKTTVALNLAVAFAQSGKSVLIIDTDMRRPRVHRTFDVSMEQGVSTCIVNETTLSSAVQDTGIPNLRVLPCGPIPPNPSELLHHPRFAELLAEARDTYDLVMLDSPPLGPVTDAAIVAPQVDATLLVVRADQTTRDAVSGMLRQLTDVSARVVGCVLNGVDLSKGGSYSRYYRYKQDGYAYASSEDAAAE
ncbi:MAG: CpsD/CapB family tyrosine-protein kinase [Polyangiales bacterium]